MRMEDDENRYYVFVEICGKRYGLPADRVREVFQLVEPTPVPAWPEDVLGLMDVRGALVPLVDVSRLLGHPHRPLSKSMFILMISALERDWGMVVDQVDAVRPTLIQTSHDLMQRNTFSIPAVCMGVAMDAQGPIIILDSDALIGPVRAATDATFNSRHGSP